MISVLARVQQSGRYGRYRYAKSTGDRCFRFPHRNKLRWGPRILGYWFSVLDYGKKKTAVKQSCEKSQDWIY